MAECVDRYKEIPDIGDLLLMECGSSCVPFEKIDHTIIRIKKEGTPNDDGSYCYKLNVKCWHCGYEQTKPVFYNLYQRGEII